MAAAAKHTTAARPAPGEPPVIAAVAVEAPPLPPRPSVGEKVVYAIIAMLAVGGVCFFAVPEYTLAGGVCVGMASIMAGAVVITRCVLAREGL